MKRKLFIILFTLIAIFLNFLGARIATYLTFPLYLDSVFTIGVTAIYGWLPGLICAIASNGLLVFFGYIKLPFILCHISTTLIASAVFQIEKKRNIKLENRRKLYSVDSFMIIGFLVSLSNTAIGSTISAFVLKAYTDVPQVDNAVQGIFIITENLTFATLLGGTITNLADKMISSFVSFLVYFWVNKIHLIKKLG